MTKILLAIYRKTFLKNEKVLAEQVPATLSDRADSLHQQWRKHLQRQGHDCPPRKKLKSISSVRKKPITPTILEDPAASVHENIHPTISQETTMDNLQLKTSSKKKKWKKLLTVSKFLNSNECKLNFNIHLFLILN